MHYVTTLLKNLHFSSAVNKRSDVSRCPLCSRVLANSWLVSSPIAIEVSPKPTFEVTIWERRFRLDNRTMDIIRPKMMMMMIIWLPFRCCLCHVQGFFFVLKSVFNFYINFVFDVFFIIVSINISVNVFHILICILNFSRLIYFTSCSTAYSLSSSLSRQRYVYGRACQICWIASCSTSWVTMATLSAYSSAC